jgi:hypothetical protein
VFGKDAERLSSRVGPESPCSFVYAFGPSFLAPRRAESPSKKRGAGPEGYDTPMQREADYYTPGETASLLGLTEFTVLGLLTSGQLEGHQDDQARWWIPAAAVDEAVRRSRDADPLTDPSAEETVSMPPVSPGPHGSEDTPVSEDSTTSNAAAEDEGRRTEPPDMRRPEAAESADSPTEVQAGLRRT